MEVRALRGVCAGVGRNLKTGDRADIDPGTASFLVSIGAVEVVNDEPVAEETPPETSIEKSAAEKSAVDDKPKSKSRKQSK